MGGYRKGSGRSKSGYYKGIYCGSTYELCWVIYAIDHNIIFDRFPGFVHHAGKRYYPDFLLADGKTIIETKGYEKQDSVDIKTKIAEINGYSVVVLRKNDLEFAFSYVYEKYGTNSYFKLYDQYKPKYTYNCAFCHLDFSNDVKKNKENKFCSRSCSGKFRKELLIRNDDWKAKISKTLTGKKPTSYKRKYKQMWITNGKINTRIKIGEEIPEGFRKGKVDNRKH